MSGSTLREQAGIRVRAPSSSTTQILQAFAGVSATASAGSDHHGGPSKVERHHRFGLSPHGRPSVQRFNLDGYVLDTDYTLGRNTGNTFEQTYTGSSVQGVPIAGPNVGVTFPPEKY